VYTKFVSPENLALGGLAVDRAENELWKSFSSNHRKAALVCVAQTLSKSPLISPYFKILSSFYFTKPFYKIEYILGYLTNF
jgi:hypothetical protein